MNVKSEPPKSNAEPPYHTLDLQNPQSPRACWSRRIVRHARHERWHVRASSSRAPVTRQPATGTVVANSNARQGAASNWSSAPPALCHCRVRTIRILERHTGISHSLRYVPKNPRCVRAKLKTRQAATRIAANDDPTGTPSISFDPNQQTLDAISRLM